MKKLLVLLVVCLGLLVAAPTMAADWSLTFGLTTGNAGVSYDSLSIKDTSDMDGFMFAVECQTDPWGFGLLYSAGDLDDLVGGKDDFYLGDVWGGYRIAGSQSFGLNLVLDYVNMRNGDYNIHAPLIGLSADANLGSGWTLQGGFGFSIGGVAISSGGLGDMTDESASKLFLKVGYEFAPNWTLGIGAYQYRYSANNVMGDMDGKANLYTLGLTYRFGSVKPAEEPKKEEPKVEEPKKEEPKEEPKVEEPKKEEPKEEPKVEEPKKEEPKVEEPKQEEPKEEPKVEEPKKEETPEQKQERITRINEFLHPIFFDFDKDEIRADQLPYLFQSLKVLKENPDLFILIAGHADAPGTNDYNKKLSERRAKRIAEWLIANGIEASRISMVGYGEEYPYMAKSNDPNWESDRWVDIVVSDEPLAQDAGIRQ